MSGSNALMIDLYQLTMAAGYFRHGLHEKRVSFELFVRRQPPNRAFLLFAGLERALAFLADLRFSESQVAFLREIPSLRAALTPDLVAFLERFRFRGDVWAMPEGTVCFQREPMIRVTGSLVEAQLAETFLLSVVNTATMVASKAARIVAAAKGRDLLEFGTRRTSPEEGVASARAAYIAGFTATSNVEAGYRYGIPLAGTAAHSWTMAHESEELAFRRYTEAFPDHATLLVDTYETLEGVRRAIRAVGPRLKGIRLDSGDLLDLSKRSRRLLDAAGLTSTRIVASGDLNEDKIASLVDAGAPIDVFGVGTELVRSRDAPTLGAVYKLVFDHSEGRAVAKFSEGKATLPGQHQVIRRYRGGIADHDVITTADEEYPNGHALLEPWMKDGSLTRELPGLDQIRARAQRQLAELPEAVRCPTHSHDTDHPAYEVRISPKLQTLAEDTRKRSTP